MYIISMSVSNDNRIKEKRENAGDVNDFKKFHFIRQE